MAVFSRRYYPYQIAPSGAATFGEGLIKGLVSALDKRDQMIQQRRMERLQATMQAYGNIINHPELFTKGQAKLMSRELGLPEPQVKQFQKEREKELARERALRMEQTKRAAAGTKLTLTQEEIEREQLNRLRQGLSPTPTAPKPAKPLFTFEDFQRQAVSLARSLLKSKGVNVPEGVDAIDRLIASMNKGFLPEEWKQAYTEAAPIIAQQWASDPQAAVLIQESWLDPFGIKQEIDVDRLKKRGLEIINKIGSK